MPHIAGMPVVRFVSRRQIRKQALEDAARALEGLAEVATSAETTKAHLEAADLVSTMADHA